jgi:hypothetical protein
MMYDTRAGTDAPTEDDVRSLIMHVGNLTTKHGPRGLVAFVVRDPLLLKMSRWYSKLGNLTGLTVRVFTSRVEAEDWLDRGGDA